MTLSEPQIGALIAALARVGGLAATAPVIADPGTSLRARLVFELAIAAAIGVNRPPVPLSGLPAVAAVELAVGLATGFIARAVVSRVAIAGQLMGLSLGLGFAAQYDPHAGESAGVLRSLATTLAGLAFLAAGGLSAIVRSAAAGPADLAQLTALGPALVHHATAAFGHGLALAAPIVLAALVGNLALAVMNRAAPAVNVFSIALAAVLLLGGVLLLATAAHLVGGAIDTARTAIDVLAGS
ncbi:MAG: flagellar biosynthetic protein FliR [Deltaproteobacteria bacterium]|nr:MAG: flagellar biosynthetic protein FliR [Deltaproteobacteria bacterium]TMQ12023.1 MAG: flagellar biosynthetic protein FliR [Deltaproteobacteria bacterium]